MIYRAFGLNLESPFPLTQFSQGNGRADAQIQIGEIIEHGRLDQIHLCIRARVNQVILAVPDLGRFSIEEGNQIIFSPIGEVDPVLIELFLTDYALGYLLLQREHLVFQATALSVFGQGLLISGASSSGKSSMAVGLWQRDHTFLGEDLGVVKLCEHSATLLPGVPRLKLWEDRLAQQQLNPGNYQKIRADQARYLVPTGDATCEQHIPLKQLIYLLDWNKEHIRALPLGDFDKIHWLQKSCFGSPATLAAMGLAIRHFKLLTRIAQNLRVTQLNFPRGQEYLAAMQDKIEEICRT